MRRLNFAFADAWRRMAHGVLVDETALMAVLDSRRLSAAGFDCFVTKPFGNPALAGYDNVFMLPHIGSLTGATRDAMGFWTLENLDAFLAG
jgi:lactate dehydrogenase-like 2-hydroxyacid dehydrogenase